MSKFFCRQMSIYADCNHEDMSTLRNRYVIIIIIIINIIIIIIMYRFHSLWLEIFLFTEGRLRLITSGL